MDSSAYVKLVLREPEADALTAFLASAPPLVSSALLAVEAVRACARYGVERAAAAEAGLATVALVPVDQPVLSAAAALRPTGLRTLDALHLATALSLGDDLDHLVAYDARLLEAAEAHGLRALAPR